MSRGLAAYREHPRVVFDIAFDNKAGLPAVYNAALARAGDDEAIVFVHDDVFLVDADWMAKLQDAFRQFDVVGVAGNRRRVHRQPTWLHVKFFDDTKLAWLDAQNISGSILHGKDPQHTTLHTFGPAPAACELLDGVLMAAPVKVLRAAGVAFDERFRFDYYDLDFCRSARAAGLRVGTWPVSLIHQSIGHFGEPAWIAARTAYFEKWDPEPAALP